MNRALPVFLAALIGAALPMRAGAAEPSEVGVVRIHGLGLQREPSPTVAPSPCVLPEAPWVVADAPKPSPNTIEAVVLTTGAATIDVRVTIPDDRPLSLQLRTNSDTRLVSVSGEKLTPSDLREGQHLFVWLEDCKLDPTLHSPLASAIHACPVDGCPQQGE
jgi:hypothetical protein